MYCRQSGSNAHHLPCFASRLGHWPSPPPGSQRVVVFPRSFKYCTTQRSITRSLFELCGHSRCSLHSLCFKVRPVNPSSVSGMFLRLSYRENVFLNCEYRCSCRESRSIEGVADVTNPSLPSPCQNAPARPWLTADESARRTACLPVPRFWNQSAPYPVSQRSSCRFGTRMLKTHARSGGRQSQFQVNARARGMSGSKESTPKLKGRILGLPSPRYCQLPGDPSDRDENGGTTA